jgi:hypothetical protein
MLLLDFLAVGFAYSVNNILSYIKITICGACRWRRRRRRSRQRWSAGSSRNLLRDVISAEKFLKKRKQKIIRI